MHHRASARWIIEWSKCCQSARCIGQVEALDDWVRVRDRRVDDGALQHALSHVVASAGVGFLGSGARRGWLCKSRAYAALVEVAGLQRLPPAHPGRGQLATRFRPHAGFRRTSTRLGLGRAASCRAAVGWLGEAELQGRGHAGRLHKAAFWKIAIQPPARGACDCPASPRQPARQSVGSLLPRQRSPTLLASADGSAPLSSRRWRQVRS